MQTTDTRERSVRCFYLVLLLQLWWFQTRLSADMEDLFPPNINQQETQLRKITFSHSELEISVQGFPSLVYEKLNQEKKNSPEFSSGFTSALHDQKKLREKLCLESYRGSLQQMFSKSTH